MSSSTFSHICGWKNYVIQAEGSSESHVKKKKKKKKKDKQTKHPLTSMTDTQTVNTASKQGMVIHQ